MISSTSSGKTVDKHPGVVVRVIKLPYLQLVGVHRHHHGTTAVASRQLPKKQKIQFGAFVLTGEDLVTGRVHYTSIL